MHQAYPAAATQAGVGGGHREHRTTVHRIISRNRPGRAPVATSLIHGAHKSEINQNPHLDVPAQFSLISPSRAK
jgi:hypothetical protein